MNRLGWTIKEAGAVLGVHPNKVPQALRPALEKVARLLVADPAKTLVDLTAVMQRIVAESDPARSAELTDGELDRLQRRQLGRLNRAELRSPD